MVYSVPGHQKPAPAHPVDRVGPQPLQVQGGGLPEVLPQGVAAALPHEVLPLRVRAESAAQHPDTRLREAGRHHGHATQATHRLFT